MAALNSRSEIGRELKAGELVEGRVVVLIKGDRAVTAWVRRVLAEGVDFFMAEINLHILLLRLPSDPDVLVDDTTKRIQAYEYLGKI